MKGIQEYNKKDTTLDINQFTEIFILTILIHEMHHSIEYNYNRYTNTDSIKKSELTVDIISYEFIINNINTFSKILSISKKTLIINILYIIIDKHVKIKNTVYKSLYNYHTCNSASKIVLDLCKKLRKIIGRRFRRKSNVNYIINRLNELSLINEKRAKEISKLLYEYDNIDIILYDGSKIKISKVENINAKDIENFNKQINNHIADRCLYNSIISYINKKENTVVVYICLVNEYIYVSGKND